jgi:hypothetical protein
MKTKIQKIKRLSTAEVFHEFAHQLDNCKSTSYLYEDNKLFYKNELVANIYDKSKKIVLIKNFNHIGHYGNGYSSYNLIRAFDESWTTLTLDNIFDITVKDKAIEKRDLFNYLIKVKIENIIKIQYWLKEYIYNPRRLTCNISINYLLDLQNKIKKEIELLKIPKKYIKTKFHNELIWLSYYKGWNKYYEKFFNNESLQYWLDFRFTEKELDVIACKDWIHTNLYNTKTAKCLSKHEKETIYFNIEKRNAYTTIIEKERADNNRLYEERLQKQKEERKAKELIKLNDWLDGKYNRALWDIPIHLRLDKDNLVETTLGVTVPLNHAKLLYLKFKQCVNKNEEWISNGCSIKIGNYLVECIKKNDVGWYLKAGCHTIYEKEIDLFINMFKLNW